MKFKERDEVTLLTALRAAAEQYDKDATTMGDGYPTTRDHFTQQAADARELADRIEQEGL